MTGYRFKFAQRESEFEQIHRLNYAAFVEEIPQHAPNPERRLVDQFHAENTYAIGCIGDEEQPEVVAMLALRSTRPFSLDRKLANLDSYLPAHRSLCEIRLLYIRPDHRNGKVMRGLMELVATYAIQHHHDMALISGTTRQQRLYRHLGFEPFGPLVGSGDAQFQPMYLTVTASLRQTPWVQALQAAANGDAASGDAASHYDPPLNYLPGPVNIAPDVMALMGQPMLSHRSAQFVADLARVQARLCALVNAPHVEFLFGSGTLGNEAVAGQISLLPSRGLMLVNGEFGRRLRDDAHRWQLDFSTIEIPWGDVFDLTAVAAALDADLAIGWLWCVHSETSSGVLNDLPGLAALCAARRVKLCVDCISSLGVVPLDLRQVYLASGTSGKALGAVAGLALVFSNYAPQTQPEHLPSYLDLGYYRQANGVPFTVDTNLVYALDRALDHFEARGADATAQTAASLRANLRARGLTLVAPEHAASPAVTTIALPAHISSLAVGDALAQQGFLLSYRSKYLIARNWLQICLMGDYRADTLPDLVDALAHWTTHAAAPVTA